MGAGITGWDGHWLRLVISPHFPTAAARAPISAIAATRLRRAGSFATWSNGCLRCEGNNPGLPIALAGISWGGKLAVVVAARHPELVDGIALICPGLHPRVGVSGKERLAIAWAFFTNRRKTFPIPLSDPALFTDSPEGQAFIAADPLGLHQATAGLLAASVLIDRIVARTPTKNPPVCSSDASRERPDHR